MVAERIEGWGVWSVCKVTSRRFRISGAFGLPLFPLVAGRIEEWGMGRDFGIDFEFQVRLGGRGSASFFFIFSTRSAAVV